MMLKSSCSFWFALFIPVLCLHGEEEEEDDAIVDSEWEFELTEEPYFAAAAAVAIALEQTKFIHFEIEDLWDEPTGLVAEKKEVVEEPPIPNVIATAIEDEPEETLLGKAQAAKEDAEWELEVVEEPPISNVIATVIEEAQFIETEEDEPEETLLGKAQAAKEDAEWELEVAEEPPIPDALAIAIEEAQFIETEEDEPEETLLGKAQAAKEDAEWELEVVEEPPVPDALATAIEEAQFIETEEDEPEETLLGKAQARQKETEEMLAFAEQEEFWDEPVLEFIPVDSEEQEIAILAENDEELDIEFGVTEEDLAQEEFLVAEETELNAPEEELATLIEEPILAFEDEICTPIAAASQGEELEMEFGVTEEDLAQEKFLAAEETELNAPEEELVTLADEAKEPATIEFGLSEEELFLAEEDSEIEEPIAGKEVCIDVEAPKERPIISNVKGLVLVDNQNHLLNEEDLKDIEGFCILGLDVPGNAKDLQEKLNPIYLHQPLDLSKINVIKQAIHEYFQAQHNPFIIVSVPKQCISYGILQLVVTEAKVGDIRVEGNRWFSDKCLKQYVKIAPGQGINVDTLQTDLNFINRNPFRQVNIVYAPGKQTGTTDLVLAAEDRPPFRIYAGADDTGLLTTGRERFFGGFTWGKVLGFDHILSYQYTAAYNLKSFQSHTLQYMALLPWKHTLNLYGGYSTVHAALPFPEATNLGISSQLSVRYALPIYTTPRFSDEFSFGFDYKSSNNTIEYSQLFPNVAKQVNLTQLMVEYHLNKEWNTSRLEFTWELYGSPFTFLANQSEADYETLRPNADTKWLYGKGSLCYTRKLPSDCSIMLWGRGQFAVGNLLPSEQLGIGGHATVRGYEERQLNMDNGFIGNFEFRTPPISLISTFRKHPVKDSIQLLGFIDYGVGTNNTTLPGEPNYDYLFSIGPGIRYTLDPYIAARLDWGVKLHNAAILSGGWNMIHFSGTISY